MIFMVLLVRQYGGYNRPEFQPALPCSPRERRQQAAAKPCHHQQDGVLQEREATTATSLSCKQGHGLLKQLQGRKGLEKNRTTADELREGEKWQFRETPQLNWNHYIWIRAHVHNDTVASWVKGRTNSAMLPFCNVRFRTF